MESLINGLSADAYPSDGQTAPFRQGRGGDMVSNMFGKYGEVARRGRLFHGSTDVTGAAPGTAIGTAAAIALGNPIGSGVDLIVLRAICHYKSGTLGTGHIDWIAHGNNLILPTGTAIATQNGRIGGPQPIGRLLDGATVLTGGLLFRPFAYLAPYLASTVTADLKLIGLDEVDGAIIVAPGTSVSLQATAAAGSTPLVRYGVMWAEAPV